MTGTTITTYRTIGISIGYGGITSPLTIASSGFVRSESPGGTAIYQSANQADATIFLDGGDAMGGSRGTLAGGAGVIMKGAGTLINAGEIAGGYAGGLGGDKGHGLTGGAGVELLAAVTGTNSDEILGGGGGGGYAYGGVGGVGLLLGATGASFANTHDILGGAGGGSYYDGGNGGDGVNITAAATFTNTDYVAGGYGGSILKQNHAGAGGTGIAVSGGGVFSNSGHISGGLGAGASRYATQTGDGGVGASLYNANGGNAGTITGGNAGQFYDPGNGFAGGYGGYGGEGIRIGGRSSFANAGIIGGGAGAYGERQSGAGGVGMDLLAGATASNTGTIFGGAGGGAGTAGKYGGYGEDGAFIDTASVTNSGLIMAGGGGTGPTGGNGGYGAVLVHGLLKNTGTILGGDGGAGAETGGHLGAGGNGGGGVYIYGGVFTNAGTVTAGYGGVGSTDGTMADAVQFGLVAGTLKVESGAVFNGQVVANGTIADVLELAGKSSVALTGIGTQFTNFNDISFASGAAWKIKGDVAGLAESQTIAGFAAGDTIVLDGFQEQQLGTSQGRYLNLVDGSGTETLNVLAGAAGVLLVTGGGGNTTISLHQRIDRLTLHSDNVAYVFGGGTVKDTTIANGGNLSVLGTAKDTLIKNGGIELVGTNGGIAGGVTSNTTLDGGGLLFLASGGDATGMVKMQGNGNVLELAEAGSPTGVISGFKSGDKIVFDLIANSATGTVKVKTAGEVTVSAGGKTYVLNIAGATVGAAAFEYSDSTLTEKPASQMAFLRPPATTADAMPAFGMVLPRPAAAMPTNAPTKAPAGWVASAEPMAAGVLDLLKIPHGGIQTMPTLQAG